MKRLMCILCYILLFFFFDATMVGANHYEEICDTLIKSNNGYFRQCGDNYINLIEEKEYSSHFVSSIKLNSGEQILYAGKIDGIDTFYSNKFNYFSVVYDNQKYGELDKNYWSEVYYNGILLYDGSFKDVALIDQSKRKSAILCDEKGVYLIRQRIGGQITKTIKMIVVGERDYGLDIENVQYGNKPISSSELVGKSSNLEIKVGGGNYGYGDNVELKINECELSYVFNKNILIDNREIKSCLFYNRDNILTITLYNGFGKKKSFNYRFNLISNDVSIKLENSVSETETSSRRIMIEAYAGNNKMLDEEYCLYYWSNNSNDGLSYNEFMKNYEESDNKGVYSNNRGVILRNAVGTYYLYALAKDDDSYVVVRSDEYILKKKEKLNEIIIEDVIFVVGLGFLAILPILIYLSIRGKDTE